MNMARECDGLRMLVTGGASGIGHAIAERFVANGDRVAGIDRDPKGMVDLGLDLALEGDVSSSNFMTTALDQARTSLGGLDVLVCCAGFGLVSTLPDLAEELWDRIFAVNVRGAFLMAKYGIPILREAGGGVIINIASQLGFVAAPGMGAYCATTGALIQLTRALALDHASEGIRVNAVCPGPTDTPAVRRGFSHAPDPKAAEQALAGKTAMNRLLDPSEVAGAVFFLASPDATAVTGEALVVDAGYLIS